MWEGEGEIRPGGEARVLGRQAPRRLRFPLRATRDAYLRGELPADEAGAIVRWLLGAADPAPAGPPKDAARDPSPAPMPRALREGPGG